jgi:NAD+ synthase
MTDTLAVALAQVNPTVGEVEGNVALVRKARAEAARLGADLVVFPELVITGYPPEDLVLRPAFQDAVEKAVAGLAAETADGGPALLVGTPWREDGKLYNAAVLVDAGRVASRRYKHELPNYGVFDEVRVFEPGPAPGPVPFRGVRLGIMLCEDMWFADVAETLAESGAQLLVVLNGSPYEQAKEDERLSYAVARITETGLPLVYVNQVGGQDELVFDGASFVLDGERRLRVKAPSWFESVLVSQWTIDDDCRAACADGERARAPEGLEQVYCALMTGLRDYVGKNRFPGVIIGLSGGIDSALTAAVAVDALGPERVRCVRMPSRYSSDHSLTDAAACAGLLGVRCDTVAIEPAHGAFEQMLAPSFAGTRADATEENIQARIRGVILMALSNKTGDMLVTTGNKSEMSIGYATLYGDMCGGFSVLKDVYKTTVFELARWRNAGRAEGALGPAGVVIPERIITKAPSAELKPDQTDQDSLPPYPVLDDILESLVEREETLAELAARGHAVETVRRVQRMLYLAEYKRRQAPPGVKITRRAFGRDRRYPITNGFVDRE